jgi:hypothetical protein
VASLHVGGRQTEARRQIDLDVESLGKVRHSQTAGDWAGAAHAIDVRRRSTVMRLMLRRACAPSASVSRMPPFQRLVDLGRDVQCPPSRLSPRSRERCGERPQTAKIPTGSAHEQVRKLPIWRPLPNVLARQSSRFGGILLLDAEQAALMMPIRSHHTPDGRIPPSASRSISIRTSRRGCSRTPRRRSTRRSGVVKSHPRAPDEGFGSNFGSVGTPRSPIEMKFTNMINDVDGWPSGLRHRS